MTHEVWNFGCKLFSMLIPVKPSLTFSPIDTPPDVMITSARLMPSFRAFSRSSGLQGETEMKGHDYVYEVVVLYLYPLCLNTKDFMQPFLF